MLAALLRHELAKLEEENMAMTRQEALTQLGRLAEAGFAGTLRRRSWAIGDKPIYWGIDAYENAEALGRVSNLYTPIYWGIDAYENAEALGRVSNLYTLADVSQFLLAHTPPVEVKAEVTQNFGFRFPLGLDSYLPSPSQEPSSFSNRPVNYVWSLQDIRRMHGLRVFEGKRYKLLPPDNLFDHVESAEAQSSQLGDAA